MFCTQCSSFWAEVASLIEVYKENFEKTWSDEEVRWPHYATVLYQNLRKLKESSDRRCPICRAIYFSPTKQERSSLPDECQIILEISSEDEINPILYARFVAKDGTSLLPRQILAMYSGLIKDGEIVRSRCRILLFTNLIVQMRSSQQ